ncbi:Ribosome production factor 2-like protein [Smittium mucronatum]|uniref:Ribosome production factor 2 homolog n=1 Tax=Smittium mucronatum TaxID=133383 RepID=A0A1R0H725_9FUNG|nr:Ribosome production factor 2-like protein [Smittium mucronatum]
MLPTIKPKNARSKRALVKRSSKVIENPKNTIFIRGSQTSQVIQNVLKDLYSLKKPLALNFSKKNEIHPFDDETKLEFLCNKNDTSLFTIGSHSKKRPHNLIMGRMFDFKLFEMFEFEVKDYKSIEEIKGKTCASGIKPLLVFSGEPFNQDDTLMKLQNFFVDFFQSEKTDSICLTGLEHVISITVDPSASTPPPTSTVDQQQNYKLYIRSYYVNFLNSGQKLPRVELEEMGPSIDLVTRRHVFPTEETWKKATRVPKELFVKKTKNITHDNLGNKLGRIHVGQQDISKIQTRKVRALKAPKVNEF